jgi:hypothetical protein
MSWRTAAWWWVQSFAIAVIGIASTSIAALASAIGISRLKIILEGVIFVTSEPSVDLISIEGANPGERGIAGNRYKNRFSISAIRRVAIDGKVQNTWLSGILNES